LKAGLKLREEAEKREVEKGIHLLQDPESEWAFYRSFCPYRHTCIWFGAFLTNFFVTWVLQVLRRKYVNPRDYEKLHLHHSPWKWKLT